MNRTTLHTAILTTVTVASATLLTGCSSASDGDDAPIADGHAITFNATNGSTTALEATRADGGQVGLETLGYKEVYVYGYKTINGTVQNVMPGYKLVYTQNSDNTSTTNSSGWEYVGQGTDYLGKDQEIKYWDGNSTDYRFFAVLSGNKSSLRYDNAEITSSTNVTSTGSFSMEFTNLAYMTHKEDGKYYMSDGTTEKEEKDIPMYGTMWQGDPAQFYNTPVPLAFTKPYALVRVVFVRPEGTSTTQLGKVGDTAHPLTFGPKDGSAMTGDGKVSVSWGMNSSRETATAEVGTVTLPTMKLDPLTLTNQGERYQAWPEYLMIPSTSDSVDFKCTAYTCTESKGGTGAVFEERTAVVPAQYMRWKPGYQYTYVFKITKTNEMEFSHVLEVYSQWQAGYVDKTTW